MTNNKKPLILVTNDDGVKAGGIAALIEAVRPLGEVVVVAPDKSMSGMSHAITVKVPLYLSQVHVEEGLTIYKSNGTPADCIKLGLNEALQRKPDLLVSGINHGTNSSISLHYSGTMGGAREGALYGIPAIGFSLLDYLPDANFSTAIGICTGIVHTVILNGMKRGTFYNVNIPKGNNVKGVRVCRQAKGRWMEEFIERTDPHGRNYYWLTGSFENDEPDACDTDEWVLAQGYASLVPCSIDGTCYETLAKISALQFSKNGVIQ